ncbi:nucleolar protein dao-5-like [Schistocerca serialis cubense]|uniref:nucleolar protein dao-5-like n=1 Tax=Schistocerca serialis cubense TaxID=2023355 RepID=UPI00214EAED6|nr:nucleolar protein dao-5-like [Schistocerca serialis cubense]
MANLMISTGQAEVLVQHLTPAQRKHLPVSILPKPNAIAQPKKRVPKPPPPAQTKTQHTKEPSAPAKRIKDVVKSAKKHKRATVNHKQPKKTASNQPPITKARTPSPSGSGDESDCPLVIDEFRDTTSADTTELQIPGTDGEGFQKARKTARLSAPQQARAAAGDDSDEALQLLVRLVPHAAAAPLGDDTENEEEEMQTEQTQAGSQTTTSRASRKRHKSDDDASARTCANSARKTRKTTRKPGQKLASARGLLKWTTTASKLLRSPRKPHVSRQQHQ